jgi:hypothetical protein
MHSAEMVRARHPYSMPFVLVLIDGHHMPTYSFIPAHHHQEVERRLANPFREWTWWMTAVRHLANVVAEPTAANKARQLQLAAAARPTRVPALAVGECCNTFDHLQAGRRETALFVEFQAIVKGLLAGM